MEKPGIKSSKKNTVVINKPSSPAELTIPGSVYRIQFNNKFTFNDAIKIVPYLSKLGITHCYASPILMSQKGSTHGYDIVDHNRINPEIGQEKEFDQFIDTLKSHNMGLLLDIVPNHMGVGHHNAKWMSVLKYGINSPFGHFFDIDWYPPTTHLVQKIQLPILGFFYGLVLDKQEVSLSFKNDEFFIDYYAHILPVSPASYPVIFLALVEWLKTTTTHLKLVKTLQDETGFSEDFCLKLSNNNPNLSAILDKWIKALKADQSNYVDFFHTLLEKQYYRLTYWQAAKDEINYRRFFDVNELVGLCVEDDEVFEYAHQFIFNLLANGKIDGVRIDHPDGLLNPDKYFQQLQTRVANVKKQDYDPTNITSQKTLPLFVVIEKILGFSENLKNWPIHGTTGYDYMNYLNELFVESANEPKFNAIYHKFTGQYFNYEKELTICKRHIMKNSLASELNRLSNELNKISELCWFYRDFSLAQLKQAIQEIVCHFTIYRTYVTENMVDRSAKNTIHQAVLLAKKFNRDTDPGVYEFIEQVLLHTIDTKKNVQLDERISCFSLKFQQFTGPVMAKSFEDTFFYRYYRLTSLNEVGGQAKTFGISVAAFHHQNTQMHAQFPYSLLATSTHDTKRSEDLRARINVLSELPELWESHVLLWQEWHQDFKILVDDKLAPSKNDEYLIYQTLIGLYPFSEATPEALNTIKDRMKKYLTKATREAKLHTSWVNPNAQYELATNQFIDGLLADLDTPRFKKSFEQVTKKVSYAGYLNALSQVVIKLTSPGIPDIYQGSEQWSFNLVDPDNRNPVNFAENATKLNNLLATLTDEKKRLPYITDKLVDIADPVNKLCLTAIVLNLRKAHQSVFLEGDYLPLKVTGDFAQHVVAYARCLEKQCIITIAPIKISHLVDNKFPYKKKAWGNTAIKWPERLFNTTWINNITLETYSVETDISVASLLTHYPVAVLSYTSH